MHKAVIDTNILVSALLSSNEQAATVRLITMIFTDTLIPVLTDGILEEYEEVMRRKKFGFPEEIVSVFLEEFARKAIRVTPNHADIVLSDEKDRPFLEAMLADTDAVLITGNVNDLQDKPNAIKLISIVMHCPWVVDRSFRISSLN